MSHSKSLTDYSYLAAAGIRIQLIGIDALIEFPFAEKYLIRLTRGRPGSELHWDESVERFILRLPGPWPDVRAVARRVAHRYRNHPAHWGEFRRG